MVEPDGSAGRQLAELVRRLPDFQSFMGGNPVSSVVGIAIRNDFETERDAADRAWAIMMGILDGYSLGIDAAVPKLCGYFLIRSGNSPDADVKMYSEGSGWAHLHSQNPDSERLWEAAKSKVFEHFLRFFEVVVDEQVRAQTALVHQLLYSARMFRHGAVSHEFGIQYLCKFSALEGMVSGEAKSQKRALLRSRLPRLFRKTEKAVAQTVEALWDLRCTASHQARAFAIHDLPGAVLTGGRIEDLEYLFRGTCIFALDHLKQARTIDDLWSEVANYDLPDHALFQRPSDMPRYAVASGLLDPHILWPGAGRAFDKLYTDLNSNISAVPPAHQP